MSPNPTLRRLAALGTVVAAAALVLAGCGSSSSPSTTTTSGAAPTRMVKVPGGTMTIAESAAAGPNYIFPMMGGAYFSVANFQLIYLMFRPLYWFGTGYTPDLNPGLSVAKAPVYSKGGKTVTIKMKGYRWTPRTSCSG
jgi:peptide/nickel transport system substrate-binding protein